MANSLFNALSGNKRPQGGQRNLAGALLQYMQGFQGNPIEELQSKLNSGEMSQQQYNQLYGMAQGIAQKMMSIIPHK